MSNFTEINWKKIKLVIFDVDGTLYNQSALRFLMMWELFKYYIIRPFSLYEILILYQFRKQKEKMFVTMKSDIAFQQYQNVSEKLNISQEKVYNLVEKWIHKMPLKYMKTSKFDIVDKLFDKLREKNIKIALFSEYPLKCKIKHLELFPDQYFCTTDKIIDKSKPDPKGLYVIMNIFEISPENCLYIGDRDDKDGKCARLAGVPYIILPKFNKEKEKFYKKMLDLI